ncbi:methylaspartate mutase subunit E [Treponema sp.]
MIDRSLSQSDFEKARTEALNTWPTGSALSFEAGVKRQLSLGEAKNFALVMKGAAERGRTLLQPRAGVALIDEHIKLLKYLENEGEADLLPTTIDAYTRLNRYTEAEKGIEKSLAANASLLNGFPAVNHGVEGCSRVVDALTKPVQVRHGTPDARLLAEITLASGFTAFEGGGISYNIPYAKNVPLRKSIKDWKYVDRLTGNYEREGVRINREPFGPLTGTLVPPCVSHAVAILEGLLALEQGVKSLTLGYGQCGNLSQDVAAIRSLVHLANAYFREAGFSGYELTTVFHQWMGGFPEDEAQAFGVIAWGATAARLSGATKVIVKSPHEAMGIPTKEANAQGLRTSRQVVNMLSEQGILNSSAVEAEAELIERETRALLEAAFALAPGRDPEEAAVRAFEAGIIDVPFAPSNQNRGKILPMRDDEGCVRIFNPGALPLGQDLLDYHRERLAARSKTEGRPVSLRMVTDDIYAIGKGKLVGRPK